MIKRVTDAVLYNEYNMEIGRETITDEMPYHKIEREWEKIYIDGDHIELEDTWREI